MTKTNFPNIKMQREFFQTAVLFLVISCSVVGAISSCFAEEESVFASGEDRVKLIELYTSEGCSSCPPADFWLNKLIDNEKLWTRFVPLSFHVDYWDYLGWKDRFSRAEFSQRQRRYNSLGQAQGVYTPGMFLNGLEWRNWRNINTDDLASDTEDSKNGNLKLRYSAKTINVEFTPTSEQKIDRVYVALLGFELASSIKSGENKGRNFTHNFVVLELLTSDPQFQQGKYSANFNTFEPKLNEQSYAIAAWVTHEDDSKPLQSTGGWLSNSDK